jgi:UDP-glucose 4-epimerase
MSPQDLHVFVTGAAGYIGSHTCLELLEAGFQVTAFDNYANSSVKALERVMEITGKPILCVEGDVRDQAHLDTLFAAKPYAGVIHFAGLKAVGESAEKPLEYYDNNVAGSISLLKAMKAHDIKRFIFSSSATVYGEPQFLPYTEAHPLSPVNCYGRTKFMVEEILRDFILAEPEWGIALLRYFNPVGAHQSGQIGEDPEGIPNNLMPFIAQVAVGRRPYLSVFGNDYDTPDGTGVRDYIHVVDLARGHVKTLTTLLGHKGLLTLNLGTGSGTSVLEVIAAFETAAGKKIPYEIKPRRLGDLPSYYANSHLAHESIDWQAEYTIKDMCEDTWRWQANNVNGFT